MPRDDLGLKTPGIFSTPVSVVRSALDKLFQKTPIMHLALSPREIDHSGKLGHYIQFHNTSILAKKFRCMECVSGKVTKIEVHTCTQNVSS